MTRRRRAGRHAPDTTQAADAALDALYAELPAMQCRGACWDSCGPIRMTAPERRRIHARGVDIPDGNYYNDGPAVCPALTMLHRCAVYDVRPLICRLWGLVESMPCTFGCRPEGGLLPDRDGYLLIARAMEIAGDRAAAAKLRAVYEMPGRAAAAEAVIRRDREERDLLAAVQRRRAAAAGNVLYVHGRGQISKQPPSAANPDGVR